MVSSVTGLDASKQINLLLILTESKTSQTGGQAYSFTSPLKVSILCCKY